MSRKNNIPKNAERVEKIKTKMREKFGQPIIFWGYYTSQSDACARLGVSPSELNKAVRRNGQVHGLKVIKGEKVANYLTALSKIEK